MKKLTAFVLATVFTVSIALAIINTTLSKVNTDPGLRYASILVEGPPPQNPQPDTGKKGTPGGGGVE